MDLLARGFLGVLSDAFSLVTILMCLVAKLPQIQTIYQLRSARGISKNSLYLETLSYSVMMAYNYRSGYAALTYLEYPVLLVQNYALLLLVFYYQRQLWMRDTHILIAGYFGALLLVLAVVPAAVLSLFVPCCTPIGALAKVMVLFAILRSRDSATINLTTWFISAFTNLTRIFTIYVESADTVLLFNFYVSTFLSTSVWLAAWFFKPLPRNSSRK